MVEDNSIVIIVQLLYKTMIPNWRRENDTFIWRYVWLMYLEICSFKQKKLNIYHKILGNIIVVYYISLEL